MYAIRSYYGEKDPRKDRPFGGRGNDLPFCLILPRHFQVETDRLNPERERDRYVEAPQLVILVSRIVHPGTP